MTVLTVYRRYIVLLQDVINMNIDSFFRRIICLSIPVGVLLLTCANLGADEVRRVIFEQSGYEFPRKLLEYNLQLKKGADFSKSILNNDIKRLYETGNFKKVTGNIEKTNDGRVDVVFKTISKRESKTLSSPAIRNLKTKSCAKR